jgi:hypothetical protein
MKKPGRLLLISILAILSFSGKTQIAPDSRIGLAGTWSFKTDPENAGTRGKWFSGSIGGSIQLPGSMAGNGKGDEVAVETKWTGSIFDSSYFRKPEYARYREKGNIKVPFWLQPVKYYVGPAWYQKEILIPAGMGNRRLRLTLERPHWQTTVWLDDRLIGSQNSLSTAHIFDLGKGVSAGRHRLSIRVDNGINDVNPGQNSHSITDHTQGNWNGIVGDMFISTVPDVSVERIRLYPDYKTKTVKVVAQIDNSGSSLVACTLSLQANRLAGHSQPLPALTWQQQAAPGKNTVERIYSLGANAVAWDEFSPELYAMNISIQSAGSTRYTRRVEFGLREVGVQGTRITINGQPVFLRGAVDCAVFPLTGYPPTDRASWAEIFETCRSYGLNHIRFHSWCPPEAAFEAADRAGMYLQVECASWANWGTGLGDGLPIDDYIRQESERIVDAYGNHPSFVMMAYGNEPGGKNRDRYLAKFVSDWKSSDPRRLYTAGAGWPVLPENDYDNISDPRIQQWEQGLKSIINSAPPQSAYDWSAIIAKHKAPVVSHEIGQWCVYPDLAEMKQYTGVMKAKNFEIFSDRLKENGLLSLADSFFLASGKLQALCYKADIEAALRTPGMAGFHLLGLQDFPGQGTALVGVVNPFWKSKKYITPAAYSQFCNPVTPLARFPKFNFVNNETMVVPVEVANFGRDALLHPSVAWTISDRNGKVMFSGRFSQRDISRGNSISLGMITQPLGSVTNAAKLHLEVNVNGFKNGWDFFVYPAVNPDAGNDILVTNALTREAEDRLASGGKVLLTIPKGKIKQDHGGSVAIGFSSIFWNTAWTNGQAPHTLGILCDPRHPALADFPADYHSNWQWWDAMSHSSAIFLDSVSKGMKPIIRVVDDWVTARSLGLVFECKVGKGKLIVSAVDLLGNAENRPEARQLLYSLKRYMAGRKFNPVTTVSVERILQLTD